MYDFKQLSPADFEELTRDLLQQEWKLRLESFKSGRDNGIDLRYSTVTGKSIIVQCKRYADSTLSKLIRDLRLIELPKIILLKPKRYVLVTSLALNPADKKKIKAALKPYVKKTGDIYGSSELNNLLGQYPKIETQHYKLWLSSTAVLQRVLQNAEKVQTDFDVDRVRRNIPKYVQNNNYNRALKLLDDQKIVIISGVPGIGKTTLADMLLFAHLEKSFQPVTIQSDITDAKTQFISGKPQIFYFDDFLGQTFLGNRVEFLGKKEDSAILDFIELVIQSKHARLILTTREHILQQAFQISERFNRQQAGLEGHQCILELKDYTLKDRGRILYNHIFFSELPVSYKAELLKDLFYMKILRHRNFNPRLVEWLTTFTNVKSLPSEGYQAEVERVLENPEQLWRVAFEQQISEASRSLLLALYSMGGSTHLEDLRPAWHTLHQHRAKKYNWSTAAEDWRRSLKDLEGGFLSIERHIVSFVNPSVNDFLESILSIDKEHLGDLLSATSSFKQIVNIWSLAESDKGISLIKDLESESGQLTEVITKQLMEPHAYKIDREFGTRVQWESGVRPEKKLQTMISIASRTKSDSVLRVIVKYTEEVIEFWSKHSPYPRLTTRILREVDQIEWPKLKNLEIEKKLKIGLLSSLRESASISDLSALVDYAAEENAKWTIAEKDLLVKCFENYLESTFDDDLANSDSESELIDLSGSLKEVGDYCDFDVSEYEEKVGEKLADLERPDDDDYQGPSAGRSSGAEASSDLQEESEIVRLFDGLMK